MAWNDFLEIRINNFLEYILYFTQHSTSYSFAFFLLDKKIKIIKTIASL